MNHYSNLVVTLLLTNMLHLDESVVKSMQGLKLANVNQTVKHYLIGETVSKWQEL